MKISKIYNILFKPFEFISAVIRKDKSYFGIKSPSQEFAKQGRKMSYYFVAGMQEAQVNEVKNKFSPYKIQHYGQWAEKYNHIDYIVRNFEWTKRAYEDEFLD